jgi:hypothetical protein
MFTKNRAENHENGLIELKNQEKLPAHMQTADSRYLVNLKFLNRSILVERLSL